METLFNSMGTVIYFAQGWFFYRIVCCFLTPPRTKPVKVLSWLLLTLVCSVGIFAEDMVNISLSLLLFFAVSGLLFSGPWYVKTSVVMILFPIVTALNFLHYSIGALIFFTVAGGYGLANAVFFNLSLLITLAFWYVFYLAMKKRLSRISTLLDKRSWLFLDIICLASFAAVISLVYFMPSGIEIASYPCMTACIVTNVGSIYLASYLADGIQADMERKNLRLQKNYYEELEQNQTAIRKIRHDINSHFTVLEGLLKNNETDRALSYFENLTGYVETGSRRFCQNSIVNAVLNAKYNLACDSGIDCFFHISIDGIMSIDDISLCTIFSNTLDNAIEACKKIKEPDRRKISVRARHGENGYFSYEIVNSKQNEIREKKGILLTDKDDARSHGLGIASVKEAVEKYKGTFDISYTEEEFRVVVLIQV